MVKLNLTRFDLFSERFVLTCGEFFDQLTYCQLIRRTLLRGFRQSVCLCRGCDDCSSIKRRKQLKNLLSSILLLSRYAYFDKMADMPVYFDTPPRLSKTPNVIQLKLRTTSTFTAPHRQGYQ